MHALNGPPRNTINMEKKSARLLALEAELSRAEMDLQDLLEDDVIYAQQVGFPDLVELFERLRNEAT